MLHLKREKKTNWRSHCHQGHPWTTESTIIVADKRSKVGNRRQCRICKKESYMKRKEAEQELKKLSLQKKKTYTPVEPTYS